MRVSVLSPNAKWSDVKSQSLTIQQLHAYQKTNGYGDQTITVSRAGHLTNSVRASPRPPCVALNMYTYRRAAAFTGPACVRTQGRKGLVGPDVKL